MVREQLIESAISFLQDPSVATASSDKRTAFLQSKNLTQEEIDLALARAARSQQTTHSNGGSMLDSNFYGSPKTPGQQYGPGHNMLQYHNGPWPQPMPPAPKRDWRDWFIMATVTTGVGYGLYTAAQRYIVPLIAPPTAPQLEQDKATIDESFNKAFALIDQLAADTATIKASENERSEKVDALLKDMEKTLEDCKATNSRREIESRAVSHQIQELKTFVPRALEGWKANGDARLDDLAQEVQSLKKLLENRLQRPNVSSPIVQQQKEGIVNGTKIKDPVRTNSDTTLRPGNNVSHGSKEPDSEHKVPKQEPYASNGKSGIPAWQMAAAGKSVDNESTGSAA